MSSAQEEVLCVLLQVDAEREGAKTLEKEYRAILKHSLLETEGDASSRMDGTLKEINGLLKGLILSRSVKDVHALLALVEPGGTLHVSHAGRAEAYLVRGGAASQITEYSKGKTTPAFVHISSGDIHTRDCVVLSTQRLLRTVTPAQLTQIAARGDQLLDELVTELESEKESAALAVLRPSGRQTIDDVPEESDKRGLPSSRRRRRKTTSLTAFLPSSGAVSDFFGSGMRTLRSSGAGDRLRSFVQSFLQDLRDPKRKKRAHLLLLAGTLVAFLVVWSVVGLSTSASRGQEKGHLKALMQQVDEEIATAENRRLAGDGESANAILVRAAERAKQVLDSSSGLYRMEALDLLDRIRTKREEINNIIRLSPRVSVNLSAENPDINAQGLIGLEDGEFVVYDRQDLYRILLNSIEEPDQLDDEELITDGTSFERYQSLVFQTTDNSIVELINGQVVSMKTEDPAGWIAGKDMETYLRYLYMLSPENNQIYKYERLSNRYSTYAEYNVNGDLAGALDMAIDSSVYVLKEGGDVMKLFRGEVRPFTIRYAPDGMLSSATRIYKVSDGGFYFLDPKAARVMVTTNDSGSGEASYTRQYVLEGDQVGTLQDLYVDPDETRLYVLDEKRLYVVDLATN